MTKNRGFEGVLIQGGPIFKYIHFVLYLLTLIDSGSKTGMLFLNDSVYYTHTKITILDIVQRT